MPSPHSSMCENRQRPCPCHLLPSKVPQGECALHPCVQVGAVQRRALPVPALQREQHAAGPNPPACKSDKANAQLMPPTHPCALQGQCNRPAGRDPGVPETREAAGPDADCQECAGVLCKVSVRGPGGAEHRRGIQAPPGSAVLVECYFDDMTTPEHVQERSLPAISFQHHY